MTGLFGVFSCWREILLLWEWVYYKCWSVLDPRFLRVTESTTHNVITEIYRKTRMDVICCWTLLLSSCLLYEGTLFVIVHLFLDSFSLSLLSAAPAPIPVCRFLNPLCCLCPPGSLFVVDIQRYAWQFLLYRVEEEHSWDTCKLDNMPSCPIVRHTAVLYSVFHVDKPSVFLFYVRPRICYVITFFEHWESDFEIPDTM